MKSMLAIGLLVIITGAFLTSHALSAGEPGIQTAAAQVTPPPSEPLSVCSQHAPKCPLKAANWPGPEGEWQYTGKKWTWYNRTPKFKNRITVWEYSQPYQGEVEAYKDHREDHYSDYTRSPDGWPFVEGRAAQTYDWERWIAAGENYLMMQFGQESEAESYLVGVNDCESGLPYPVVDQEHPYFFTPMSSTRFGSCTGGGYVAAQLVELWGEPMTQQRQESCDNTANGIPAGASLAGNTICKISPYVGVVYQRYLLGPEAPGKPAAVGCEAVLYAWGYQEPQNPASGQDYQAWFRNGELRWTRWHELSRFTDPNDLPAPDDHAWWNEQCQNAWNEQANWVYSGTFRAGKTVYNDQARLYQLAVANVGSQGGVLAYEKLGATYTFLPGTFQVETRLSQLFMRPEETPATGSRRLVRPAFWITAEDISSNRHIDLTGQYVAEFRYTSDEIRGLSERSLALFYWDGNRWVREATSRVDQRANVVRALPSRLSLWALMAQESSSNSSDERYRFLER